MTLVSGTDTYATVAYVDAYVASRPGYAGTWDSKTTAKKEAALIMALYHLDYSYIWKGTAAEEDQTMAWPRTGLVTRAGKVIEDDEIPADIIRAHAELALQWIEYDQLMPSAQSMTSADAAAMKGGVIREKIGGMERWYKEESSYLFAMAGGYAPARKTYPFVDLLVAFYVNGSSGGMFRQVDY